MATRQCLEGYYCPNGTANLNDEVLCPIGAYCPFGSAAPVSCAPGSYQDEKGQPECKSCPSGSYCLDGASSPQACPQGYYCPESTRFGTEHPCPEGTYNDQLSLQSVEECSFCAAGYYCGSSGLTAPTGKCEAGYFCGGGSAVSTPFESNSYQISYAGETCVKVLNSTVNDMCPPGHYCPEGSSAPVQCPPGTNSSSPGLTKESDCPSCTRGYYCPLNGTVMATRQCLEGYYCPQGTSHPSANADLVCPVGSECPLGSILPSLCSIGYYQDEVRKASCKLCWEGYVCGALGTISPTDRCPIGQYCPEGSFRGEYCSNGTYGQSIGLVSQNECTLCPAGSYCMHGEISGLCSAGYFCKIGQWTSAPYLTTASYTNEQLLYQLQSMDGGPCYPGYYCPRGTSHPIPCRNDTFRADPYGDSPSSCGSCPAGYKCNQGDPIPKPCDAGKYCPGNNQEFDCPIGTYQPAATTIGDVKQSLDNCLNCPAGYFCNATATTTYERWPCPPAHFCLIGTRNPLTCPGGTYRNMIGGKDQSDCFQCPAGSYCPEESSVYISCPAGQYCKAGSADTTICPPGYFCSQSTSVPEDCPASYYCPQGTYQPIPCYFGTYCPPNTIFPIPCPLGTIWIQLQQYMYITAVLYCTYFTSSTYY